MTLPSIIGRVVLGIETSCDETAVGVVDDARSILAHEVYSQLDEHALYEGVVPEIAARAHVERLDILVEKALRTAGLRLGDMAAIAVTGGPGLIGGLVVGTASAKALAAVLGKPLLVVNHLAAHALTARLTDGIAFPYLLLLVSGGHSQLLAVHGADRFERLGTTIDDAAGEAFDKVAKMLGLGYPGGPRLEALARFGDPTRFDLPRPLSRHAGCDLSFSGLKTAVRTTILSLGEEGAHEATRADLAASFQTAVADSLSARTRRAIALMEARYGGGLPLVVAGGVAANGVVRQALAGLAAEHAMPFIAPPITLCGDNGAMVAWAGIERLELGAGDPLDSLTRARWPLDMSASPRIGSGQKGAKA
ncbi:tRNA (adenosine(37)-N6)-threonylcarbamoyltransferase complex transferase subunit TsaD [Arboricoccus pini]|uniref:tRNA (adenosine(37)-N6)-threonylcarbamoyltransferase complex transferase subunit TsaD n=1 Tax=Arboricoccus pini TaxID=1963835 RepID=UPI001FAF085E|nr:tRNA (adenosine(37)-N6)-threonylcarbamoyltransferase complex transferase subunit TsaD [Arboricoccus pini]